MLEYQFRVKIFEVILFTITLFACNSKMNVGEQYKRADSLLQAERIPEAYELLKKIKNKCDKADPLYNTVVYQHFLATVKLASIFFKDTDWKKTLDYSLEALRLTNEVENNLDTLYQGAKYLMIKNIIVSYFGLGQIDKAKMYQDKLYAAYKKRVLPDIVDNYYNFEFFRLDNKNVWGYEWYSEQFNPEINASAKIVYYVFNTGLDGTDKEPLYILSVGTFQDIQQQEKFNFLLSKTIETKGYLENERLLSYTYTAPINYLKLRADIIEVVKGKYKPGVKTVIKTN